MREDFWEACIFLAGALRKMIYFNFWLHVKMNKVSSVGEKLWSGQAAVCLRVSSLLYVENHKVDNHSGCFGT